MFMALGDNVWNRKILFQAANFLRGADLVSCVVDLKNKTNKAVRSCALELKAGIAELACGCQGLFIAASMPEITNLFQDETQHFVDNPYLRHVQAISDIKVDDAVLVLITNRLSPVLNTHLANLRKSKKIFVIYINDGSKAKLDTMLILTPDVELIAYEIDAKSGEISDGVNHSKVVKRVVGESSPKKVKQVPVCYIILHAKDTSDLDKMVVDAELLVGKTSLEEADAKFREFCNETRPDWARLISADGETCFCKYQNHGTFTQLAKGV